MALASTVGVEQKRRFTTKAPMRYALLLCCSVIWLFFLCGFGPPRLIDRTVAPTQRLTAEEMQQWVNAQHAVNFTATALLLYDVDAKQVLFTHNADQALPPASLTKLMTALLILEQNDLQAMVTIQPEDMLDGSTMGLEPGERVTVEQLLWGLLVPSGNDASRALARHSAGSVQAFVEQMNQRSSELGLQATHFRNPDGNDADGHVTSANDILILSRQLWAYPLFRQIVATAETTIAGHALQNTNELLGTLDDANGIKTGTTDWAGQCLVASVVVNDHTVWTIVLGSEDRYADTRALLDYYQANYQWVDGKQDQGSILNRLYSADGNLWYLRTTEAPPVVLLRQMDRGNLQAFRRLRLPPPNQSWQAGMAVGTLEWRLGDQVIGTQPLLLW